ncbi:PREDICTED: transmembrane 4 L6 family member 19 [Nanorana parkeri]|uniref:transmembrane 4 L6 family member 19 n=1 Tax=Nanorana parkeri TaxID=125878 RepID=UPI000854857F|nr:PREDICTED: transmembrane 4 L6 family member 19 [Nanorana parkeri]
MTRFDKTELRLVILRMCVGKCSQFNGICLTILALLSITMNLFLLFPNLDGSYLRKDQIGSHGRRMPGVWAGGLMVLLVGIHSTVIGFKVKRLSCCGTCCHMLLSDTFSILAMIGAATSLFISAAGLFSGPYCLYQVEGGAALEWGYPYRIIAFPVFNTSTSISLPDISPRKTTCIEPPDIETWNSHFFMALCLTNILQIVLCLSQLVNAILGMLVGHCDRKKLHEVDGK